MNGRATSRPAAPVSRWVRVFRRLGCIAQLGLSSWLPLVIMCVSVLAPRLFAQTFVEVTSTSFGVGLERAVWGDIDNDGYPDLFLGRGDLYKNNRNQTFTLLTLPGAAGLTPVFGDVNNDGYLDLFVCKNGGANYLATNNQASGFARVTSGAIYTDTGTSLGAAWGDFNNDGWLDLFVANGNGEAHFVYVNTGNGILVRTNLGGITSEGNGSSHCAWVDYDNDGYADLFLSAGVLFRNLRNGSFQRVDANQFQSSTDFSWGDFDNDGRLDLLSVRTDSAVVYKNNGDGTFTPTTLLRPAGMGSVLTYAGKWVDLDNDGDLDIVMMSQDTANIFFINGGNGTFTSGTFNAHGHHRGLAVEDMDRDGFMDIFGSSIYGTSGRDSRLMRNTAGNGNKWLRVACIGRASNKSGIGAKVWVTAQIGGSSRQQVRQIGSGTGGSDGLVAHFGLGNATNIDMVRIEWPSGAIDSYTNLAVNTFTNFTEVGLPRIVQQPQSQAVYAGTNITLNVVGAGPGPFTYQWRLNATDLVGQTSSTLVLNNVQPPAAGTYSVVLSNPYGSVTSSNASLVVNDNDTDGDGMPDFWEIQYGLNPFDPTDAFLDKDGDGVLNLFEFRFGTRPDLADTDGDGLSDALELFVYRTNPLARDTDGDGIDDGVEVATGSDPTLAGSKFYYDKNDRLTGAEYANGLSIAYTYDGNGNLVRQTHFDRRQNLNGLPVAWRFLNGLSATNSSGINDLFADADGDGWSNYQEWKAGTNPTDAASKPDVYGFPGTNLLSHTWPFAVSNFVIATGQLDGIGADEIVISADGNPGATNNFLLILSQTSTGWTTQQVNVGSFGVTSLAIGQVTNRSTPNIYVGLREPGGTGRVSEVTWSGTDWAVTTLATSTNDAASILGVRVGSGELLASFSPTNGPAGALYRLSPSNTTVSGGWNIEVEDAEASYPATHGALVSQRGGNTLTAALRLGASGDVLYSDGSFPPVGLVGQFMFSGNANDSTTNGRHGIVDGAVPTADRFGNPNQAYSFNGNAVIKIPGTSSALSFASGGFSLSAWVSFTSTKQFKMIVGKHNPNGYFLEGYGDKISFFVSQDQRQETSQSYNNGVWHHVVGVYDGTAQSIYVDGALVAGPRAWPNNSPNTDRDVTIGGYYQNGNTTDKQATFIGSIDDVAIYSRPLSASEVLAVSRAQSSGSAKINRPALTNWSVWRGPSLTAGALGGINGRSLFHGFLKIPPAGSGTSNAFVMAEYQLIGANWVNVSLTSIPLTAAVSNASYGLAAISYLGSTNDTLFTAEPGGQVFVWSATNGTGPLHRQLFSSHHVGNAWHALAGVKTLEPGEGLVGLRVTNTAPNTCNINFWAPQSELWKPAEVPNTAPVATLLNTITNGGNTARVRVKTWDGEGNPVRVQLQYSFSGQSNWVDATLLSVDGMAPSAVVSAPPTGADHELLWNVAGTPGLLAALPTMPTNLFLRIRPTEVAQLTGEWSPAIDYRLTGAAAPAPLPDALTVLEDSPTNILVSTLLGNDGAGVGLAGVAAFSTQGGTLVTNATGILYTPPTNFFGTDTFIYTVTNASGVAASALVTVTVLPVDDPPTLDSIGDLFLYEHYGTLLFRLTGISAGPANEGQVVTNVSAVSSNPSLIPHPTVSYASPASSALISFTPVRGALGSADIKVVVRDNGSSANGGTNEFRRTFRVTISPDGLNQAPQITLPPPVVLAQGASARFTSTNAIVITDDAGTNAIRLQLTVSNGALSFSDTNGLAFVSGTNGGTNLTVQAALPLLNASLTNLTWQPSSNFFGTDALQVVVDDRGFSGIGGPMIATASLPLFVAKQPNFPPLIVVSPEGRTVPARSDVTFAVVAAGTGPLAYQWQSNGVALAGATNATLTLTGVTTNHAASYQVVVTNAIGAVTSTPPAALVVNRLAPGLAWPTPAPIVYGTPLGGGQLNATNLAGGTLTYTPAAGTNLPAGSHSLQVGFVAADPSTYSNETRTVTLSVVPALLQARADDKSREYGQANPPFTFTYGGFVNGDNASVVTTAPVATSAATAGSLPGTYAITGSGGAAANYVFTHIPGVLTVFANAPVLTQPPTNLVVVATSNATFTVTAVGTAPLSYQWRFNGTNLTGATNSTLTVTNAQAGNAGAYTVLVGNVAGSALSEGARLTVLEAPVITVQPQGQTVGAGSSVAFGVVAAGTGPLAYQWQSNTVAITGATNAVLVLANVQPHTASYLVLVTNTVCSVFISVATLTVLAPPVTNSPPSFVAVPDQVVFEGQTLTLTNLATDADLPAQVLTFRLASPPAGATINPTTGVFTWTPSEAQGPSTNQITVVVTDNGTPPMVAVSSFSVKVLEVNAAPVLSLTNVTVVEGTTLVLSGYATDPDLPPNILTYELLSVAPAGLAFNPANGLVTWTPSEVQGPGSYPLTIRVVDNGTPSLSATQTITVTVLETNSPPVLGAIPNQIIYQGDTLVIPITATDPDLPPNLLSFTNSSFPFTNAFITNATFVWRPSSTQANVTTNFTIVVTDNGSPFMSATQTFQITVNPLAQVSAQSFGGNQIRIGVAGRANVVYTLEASSDLVTWQSLIVSNSATGAFEHVEATTPVTRRFYRIREQRQF